MVCGILQELVPPETGRKCRKGLIIRPRSRMSIFEGSVCAKGESGSCQARLTRQIRLSTMSLSLRFMGFCEKQYVGGRQMERVGRHIIGCLSRCCSLAMSTLLVPHFRKT